MSSSVLSSGTVSRVVGTLTERCTLVSSFIYQNRIKKNLFRYVRYFVDELHKHQIQEQGDEQETTTINITSQNQPFLPSIILEQQHHDYNILTASDQKNHDSVQFLQEKEKRRCRIWRSIFDIRTRHQKT